MFWDLLFLLLLSLLIGLGGACSRPVPWTALVLQRVTLVFPVWLSAGQPSAPLCSKSLLQWLAPAAIQFISWAVGLGVTTGMLIVCLQQLFAFWLALCCMYLWETMTLCRCLNNTLLITTTSCAQYQHCTTAWHYCQVHLPSAGAGNCTVPCQFALTWMWATVAFCPLWILKAIFLASYLCMDLRIDGDLQSGSALVTTFLSLNSPPPLTGGLASEQTYEMCSGCNLVLSSGYHCFLLFRGSTTVTLRQTKQEIHATWPERWDARKRENQKTEKTRKPRKRENREVRPIVLVSSAFSCSRGFRVFAVFAFSRFSRFRGFQCSRSFRGFCVFRGFRSFRVSRFSQFSQFSRFSRFSRFRGFRCSRSFRDFRGFRVSRFSQFSQFLFFGWLLAPFLLFSHFRLWYFHAILFSNRNLNRECRFPCHNSQLQTCKHTHTHLHYMSLTFTFTIYIYIHIICVLHLHVHVLAFLCTHQPLHLLIHQHIDT